ncbi:NADH-quinone oxidoreductase subunit A [Bdellovibrionota bacterium FG-2]
MAYIPVLILLGLGLAVGGAVLVLTHLIGTGIPNRKKNQPFECGVPGMGDARHRVSVRFYLVAILFLLFDVEAIFFFPWALVFKKYLSINSFILLEMAFFVAIFLVGYFYVLRKRALDWD